MFDDEESGSGSDLELKTNTEYAKNYNTWRKKEEQHKLETKYGADCFDGDDDSSSSSDSDSEEEVKFEKDFLKTLSFLKKKDPRIYDENYKFYNSDDETEKEVLKKKKKDVPVYLKDYERKLLLEKGGHISDEDEAKDFEDYLNQPKSKTYVEEQKELKENLKAALSSDVSDEEDKEFGGLFKTRQKTAEEKREEDEKYSAWLRGQTEHLQDTNTENELKPLKDYWNDPKLDENEQLLRDYILKGKFASKKEDPNYIPTYDEIIHDSDDGLSEDEKTVETQENFEHKYNFRYEEPDQEFIKQYPRTISGSVRYTDDKRKVKRNERKERKAMEKQQKMEELNQLQTFKRMEIEEKIKQLREVTGNENICFKPEDLDGDFDPEKYDRAMQNLFNDEFYQGEEEYQKPEFPDLDKELEIESWDRWNGQDEQEEENDNTEAHCEDDNFNMDCDYDPTSVKKELTDKRKKKRKRKSQFAEAISKSKPVFDPSKKTFSEYLDEYYALNCEDIVDNQPCRFQYRQVQPNSFGLSLEEILMAKDKELNKWCSIKKTVQYRPAHVEANEVKIYAERGQRIHLKKKFLPSLFTEETLQDTQIPSTKSNETEETDIEVNHDLNTKKKSKKNLLVKEGQENDPGCEENKDSNKSEVGKKIKKKGKIAKPSNSTMEGKNEKLEFSNVSTQEQNDEKETQNESHSDALSPQTGKKKRRKPESNDEHLTENEKLESSNVSTQEPNDEKETQNEPHGDILSPQKGKKNKKKRRKQESTELSNDQHSIEISNQNKKRKKSQFKNDNPAKKRKTEFNKSTDIGISDARLQAYGLNPKKFKNKLKYKK